MNKLLLMAALLCAPVASDAQIVSDGTADGPYERLELFANSNRNYQTFIARGDYLTRFDIWFWGGTSTGLPWQLDAFATIRFYAGTASVEEASSPILFRTFIDPLHQGRFTVPLTQPIQMVPGAVYTMMIYSDGCAPEFVGLPGSACPPITGVKSNPTLAVSVEGGADLYADGAWRGTYEPPSATRDVMFYAEYSVPEPSTLLLTLSGVAIGLMSRRRRA